MEQPLHLYLFTLEVVPLEVGKTYNPLPSHLTLISRFYTRETPEHIARAVNDLFAKAESMELTFGESATIGPKHTAVHLIRPNDGLKGLHSRLAEALDRIGVEYTQPEYIREGWKPHVSRREHDGLTPGTTQPTKAAYLIEVHKQGEDHFRTIQEKFKLGDNTTPSNDSNTHFSVLLS